jgi:hypothetical protein
MVLVTSGGRSTQDPLALELCYLDGGVSGGTILSSLELSFMAYL